MKKSCVMKDSKIDTKHKHGGSSMSRLEFRMMRKKTDCSGGYKNRITE
jgi:hypothetical protein